MAILGAHPHHLKQRWRSFPSSPHVFNSGLVQCAIRGGTARSAWEASARLQVRITRRMPQIVKADHISETRITCTFIYFSLQRPGPPSVLRQVRVIEGVPNRVETYRLPPRLKSVSLPRELSAFRTRGRPRRVEYSFAVPQGYNILLSHG